VSGSPALGRGNWEAQAMAGDQAGGPDYGPMINDLPDGWAKANGLRFLTASADSVTAEMAIGPHHLQPYGIVHGGVYAGIVEALASVGAVVSVMPAGKSAVGLENHTSFIRACREGTLHASAAPITRGSRTQVWEVTIRDDAERVAAVGRVRMLVLDSDSSVAGADLSIKRA
jgi:1,4-dihydroxy-2-naphthoyl-CoA hydrolase